MTTRLLRLGSASIELIFAASLWGFGFVATIWALQSWDAVQMVSLRFAFGAVVGLSICFLGSKPSKPEFWWLVRASFWPAFWITAMLVLQTWGLRYTTATKSGFITTLYIVLVPCFETVFYRKPPSLIMWLFVGLSLLGIVLIIDPSWSGDWNIGDLLTLGCSLAAALQILAVDKVSSSIEKSFLFNCLQSAWGFLLTLPLLAFSHWTLWPSAPPSLLAWVGLFSLAAGSTLIAFYLQVKAQKILSPTVSSLFFLLESPFALLFAFWLLQERLSARQGVGAALLLVSALLATLRESNKKKSLPVTSEMLSSSV